MLDMIMVALIGFSGLVNACAASESYSDRNQLQIELRTAVIIAVKLNIPLVQSFRYYAL